MLKNNSFQQDHASGFSKPVTAAVTFDLPAVLGGEQGSLAVLGGLVPSVSVSEQGAVAWTDEQGKPWNA